jgi:vacuolar protein sorting-associated protein 13A/C
MQHPEEIPEPQLSAAGQVVYFEVLELQPIQLSLSFMRTERVSSDEKYELRFDLSANYIYANHFPSGSAFATL